ncbi:peroxiredoxin family protein [Jiulongibacter sediminis]|uniref:Alkyl hydroperoxide reductase n=1 Tax=Jiulongibacter sediminis TaxID=1605367 RepID=A0A0P7BPF1_9BACT|nr:TlpA disulfide reductase family protein [Jiulongibacter sediminis]KPM49038.1 alkyl hydroperoxide reductase [Jiulongibacter sediminis]TBX25553.1 alkyl hydroperoxide reductase [Jiulongibacter sediminis]
MKKLILLFPFLGLLFSCSEPTIDLDGLWRASVPTVIGEVPFHLKFEKAGDGIHVYAVNGKEVLELDELSYRNDSLVISMEVFDAEIIAKQDGDELKGIYSKKLGNLDTRSGAFYAKKGIEQRFDGEPGTANVSGKWATTFYEEEGDSYAAIGLFEQNGAEVNGTFLTTTGDYRFLAGNVIGDSLKMSCFDGTHIFLFKAKIEGDSLKGGRFSSSLLYQETWLAAKDENAELPDAETLTYLKDGYDSIEFAFPNEKGEMVSLKDEKYQGKVVLVQILGSWCPNCMDESKFYVKWLNEHPDAPVEIVGLAFEKKTDPEFAFPKIQKMKERFGMDYEVLLAGLNSGKEAAKALPMLNHVMSFPTTIYVDKQGKVRKIHTGFSGPGTGEYYEKFTEDFDRFMEKLIAEEV